MDNREEILHKAGVLMQSALKKYNEGDFESGNKDRHLANELYDQYELMTNSESSNILYGENRNFGIIYKVIEENASDLLTNKPKLRQYKHIIQLIRENKILRQQFDVYSSLTNATNIKNPSDYVNEVVDTIGSNSAYQIREANDKLIELIRKYNLDELIDISDEQMKLFESIENLLLNKQSSTNAAIRSNAKSIITEYVTKHAIQSSEKTDIDRIFNENIEQLTSKYNQKLNDDEKALIENIFLAKDKQKLFNQYKTNAIASVNKMLQEASIEDKNDYANIIEKINNKKFDNNTIVADTAEFAEIINLK